MSGRVEILQVRLVDGPCDGQEYTVTADQDPIRVAVPPSITIADYQTGTITIDAANTSITVALYRLTDDTRRHLAAVRLMTPAARMQRGIDPIRVPARFWKHEGDPDPARYPVTLTGGPWDGRTIDLQREPHLVAAYRVDLADARAAWYAPEYRRTVVLDGPPTPIAWRYVGTQQRTPA